MKTYILIICLFYTLISFSQTIKPVETEWTVDNRDNTYFKDINNQLNKFVGTWKYEDTATNTIFEITFTKVVYAEGHKNGYVYELSAQFKLTINGIEQYNTYTTPCEDCFIASGFCFYKEDEIINNKWVFTQPNNNNMYVGCFAEPNIEQYVLSSDLKLEYELGFGNLEKLIWSNRINTVIRIATGQHMNNYQIPLNMVLIKQ